MNRGDFFQESKVEEAAKCRGVYTTRETSVRVKLIEGKHIMLGCFRALRSGLVGLGKAAPHPERKAKRGGIKLRFSYGRMAAEKDYRKAALDAEICGLTGVKKKFRVKGLAREE